MKPSFLRHIIQDCTTYCAKEKLLPLVLFMAEAPTPEMKDSFKDMANIAGLAHGITNAEFSFPEEIGNSKTVAVIAPCHACHFVSFKMALHMRHKGITRLVMPTPTGWRTISLSRFLLQRFVEKGIWVLSNRKWARIPGAYRHQTHAFKTICSTRHNETDFQKGRIVLFNNSLAWGGAERQITNTLTGLKARGHNDLHLLCNHIHSRPAHDFYLHHLEKADISASEIERRFTPEEEENLATLIQNFKTPIAHMQPDMAGAVVTYALELMHLKPEVVHAWQDSTSIIAGLAAVMAGVPRIVLAGRNMTPRHFGYFQPWMKPAYQALAKHPNVAMINNSNAGARDYEKWLGLQMGKIRTLFNGMDGAGLMRAPDADITAWRKQIGIPDDARLIGSIFRFYPEKDPMLWVETAARVAMRQPDTAFVILGEGPLRAKMEDAIFRHGLENRFFLPGVDKRNALALSALDVFLLTSKLEGTPNVCIEAQWLGVPVVATDAGGTADTFAQDTTGFLVHDRKAELLAERISFILDHPDWAQNAHVMAPDFVKSRFGMERMIDETLDVYGLA